MTGHADVLRHDLTGIIADAIRRQPRTLQATIGPSEIGIPCDRAILHKLAGSPDPRAGEAAWRPAVGTAIHALLEQWFAAQCDGVKYDEQRWLVERRVTIGDHAGHTITGTCDLYDTHTGTVIDWKTASATRLKQYRTQGPSDQYRIQAHLYGLGYARQPGTSHVPRHVALAWLPRDGDLRDMHVWTEPWQPQIAFDALDRLDRLHDELIEHGLADSLTNHPACTDTWCGWCRDTTRPTTLADAFAQATK